MKNSKPIVEYCIAALLVIFSILGSLKAIDITASLRFSHKTHFKHNIKCESCHLYNMESGTQDLPAGWQPLKPSRIISHQKSFTAKVQQNAVNNCATAEGSFGRPPEKICVKCHSVTVPDKSGKKLDCALCHLAKPGLTERNRHRLLKGTNFSHESHKNESCLRCHPQTPEWESLNGNMIDMSMQDCLECHTGVKIPRNCIMCHNPTPHPRDHTRNYQNKHGLSYRSDPAKCKTCHSDSSCLSCHARKPRSHTLAWTSRRHGLTAAVNPEKCQACHSDRSICLRCHENRL